MLTDAYEPPADSEEDEVRKRSRRFSEESFRKNPKLPDHVGEIARDAQLVN